MLVQFPFLGPPNEVECPGHRGQGHRDKHKLPAYQLTQTGIPDTRDFRVVGWELPTYLAVLLLALTSACAQTDNLEPQAKALVTAMAKQQFSKVEASFDSTMASALPASQLSAAWDTLISQRGDFKAIVGTRQIEAEAKGYRIVYVTCRFAEDDVDVKVVSTPRARSRDCSSLPLRRWKIPVRLPSSPPKLPVIGWAHLNRVRSSCALSSTSPTAMKV